MQYFGVYMEEGEWILYDNALIDLHTMDEDYHWVAYRNCRHADTTCAMVAPHTGWFVMAVLSERFAEEDLHVGLHHRIQLTRADLDIHDYSPAYYMDYEDPDSRYLWADEPGHPHYEDDLDRYYGTEADSFIAQPAETDDSLDARSFSTNNAGTNNGPVRIDGSSSVNSPVARSMGIDHNSEADREKEEFLQSRLAYRYGSEQDRAYLRERYDLEKAFASDEYEWTDWNHYAQPMIINDEERVRSTPICVIPDNGGCSTKEHFNASPQHHLEQAKAWDAWRLLDEQELTHSPRVAVIDSGIWTEHEYFNGALNLDNSYDFVSDFDNNAKGGGIGPDPTDPGNEDSVEGSNYHGTHVAGIVVRQDNYEPRYYDSDYWRLDRIEDDYGREDDYDFMQDLQFGAAPNVDLTAIRVLGVEGAEWYDTAQGILYAAGLPNDSGTVPDRPADVINLSLGGPNRTMIIEEAVNRARAAGVTVVAASGNSGDAVENFPASYGGVISVGSINALGNPSLFTTQNFMNDIAAVGGSAGIWFQDRRWSDYIAGVYSADKGWDFEEGEYGSPESDFISQKAGTSMSAPQVAAGISMMHSVYPDMTPGLAEALIEQGYLTQDLGEEGWDLFFGHGSLDYARAVRTAIELRDGELDPADIIDPVTMGDGDIVLNPRYDHAVFRIERNHGNPIGVQDVELHGDGLSLVEVDVDPFGLGVYRIEADRDGLDAGSHEGSIVATLDDGTQQRVEVILNVKGGTTWGEMGSIYVMAIPVGESEPAYSTIARQNLDGTFDYQLNGLEPGEYIIAASTDIDAEETFEIDGEVHGRFQHNGQDYPVDVPEGFERIGVDFKVDAQTYVDEPSE